MPVLCPHMRLGVCSWSLRPESPGTLAEAIKRMGIRACQLALVPVIERAEWKDAFGLLRRAGIEVLSGMLAMRGEDYSTLESIQRTGGVALAEHWPHNLRMAQRTAELAAAEGIPLVTFHAGFLPHNRANSGRRELLERLRAIVEVFAVRSIMVGFETGQEDAETLLEVMEDLAMPAAGINFDPANMILYGMGDPIDALKRLAAHVVQAHVKDATPTRVIGTWGQEVVAGTGAVDWRRFFKAISELPRGIDLVIEREAGPSREADIAVAAAMVRRHVSWGGT